MLLARRCLIERDPIAQKHSARIQKLRGTYDSMGNRMPPEFEEGRGRRRKKRLEIGKVVNHAF